MAVLETAIAVAGAAGTAIQVLQDAVDATERSCVIEVTNMTAETLEFEGSHHGSGGFAQGPPARIDRWDNGLFSCQNTALLQGVEGRATFRGRDMRLHVDFVNPFVGGNECHATVDGPRAGEFQVQASAGPGNTGALFRCAIAHPFQDNWRFCGRCHGLFWAGPDEVNHRCPSGSVHLPLGFTFVVPHSIPEGPRIQSGWRFCTRCHGMFFEGPDRNNHRCPAGGLHDGQGLVFGLPHDLPETRSLQGNWRFCGNCHGMFFNGPDQQNHRCPGGGLHNPLGFEFALPHLP